MADTHETIADIIAEMRGMGNYQRYSGDHARVLAGRIEAAHKRERGNAAKLREALKRAWLFVSATRESFAFVHEGRIERDKLCDDIDAALSAPSRNCDRFATVDEARKAHEAICEKYGKCHNGCPLNNEEHYSAFDCFEAWLFAPATEKEGGNDGDK